MPLKGHNNTEMMQKRAVAIIPVFIRIEIH